MLTTSSVVVVVVRSDGNSVSNDVCRCTLDGNLSIFTTGACARTLARTHERTHSVCLSVSVCLFLCVSVSLHMVVKEKQRKRWINDRDSYM